MFEKQQQLLDDLTELRQRAEICFLELLRPNPRMLRVQDHTEYLRAASARFATDVDEAAKRLREATEQGHARELNYRGRE